MVVEWRMSGGKVVEKWWIYGGETKDKLCYIIILQYINFTLWQISTKSKKLKGKVSHIMYFKAKCGKNLASLIEGNHTMYHGASRGKINIGMGNTWERLQ